jgi:hypothetical protein
MKLLNRPLYVVDLEADNLLDEVTKVHCLCYQIVGTEEIVALTNPTEIKELLEREDITIIAHNGIRYDLPVAKKVLGVEVRDNVIDTLTVSWYAYPNRNKHSIESWGEDVGIQKVAIQDEQWKGAEMSPEEHQQLMILRCSEDVKINMAMWKKAYRYLVYLYETPEKLDEFLQYLMFKTECVRDQEALGLEMNVPAIQELLAKMEGEAAEKLSELASAMPKVPKITKKKKPKVMHKKDGALSVAGESWMAEIQSQGIIDETIEEIGVLKGYEDPNPGSDVQLKKWLYNLGWVPETFDFKRNKETGEVKQVAQIGIKNSGGEICPSVKKLYEKEPKLELLEGLGILEHRIAMLKGFLRDLKGTRIYPSAKGLTNTLRLKHAVVVNLPGGGKKYADSIRSLFIPYPGHVLCGSDLSGIEDATKRHYIFKYDPEYVREMQVEGFDPHIDIGIRADMISPEDGEWYKEETIKMEADMRYVCTDKERYKRIKNTRSDSKVVNFSATYKVGAATLARNSKKSESWARKVLQVYWERNKAILEIERDLLIKEMGEDKWLQNPVSGFWYSLRNDKDRFSSLNQGTAVFVFDTWLKYLRALGLDIPFQYHDEALLNVLNGQEEYVKDVILEAMEYVNKKLQLNVKIGCGVKFGQDYWSVH